jgi:hypothetical protein
MPGHFLNVLLDIFSMVSVRPVRERVMVFNATFNTISVILWRSVLFVEEMFNQCPLCLALHKMQATMRLYTSSRRILQRFIHTPLLRQ